MPVSRGRAQASRMPTWPCTHAWAPSLRHLESDPPACASTWIVSCCLEFPPAHDRTRQVFRTRHHRSPVGLDMGRAGPVRAHAGCGQAFVCHPVAAAQRDRHAAHGPWLQPHDHGCADALPPHARLQHAVAAGHRPCRHRHPDRRRAPVAGRRQEPARHRAQEFRRPGLGVEAGKRQHHHRPDAAHRRHGGLDARVLHDGRHPVGGGQRDLRAAVRRRPDLSRQTPGELGPGAAIGGVGPRGRERRGGRLPLAYPLPLGRRHRVGRGRHHAARDHARRRGSDGPSRRRALHRVDRQAGVAAAV